MDNPSFFYYAGELTAKTLQREVVSSPALLFQVNYVYPSRLFQSASG